MCKPAYWMLVILLASGSPAVLPGQSVQMPAEDNFYSRRLHYTNRGIEFLYSKEQGGLERITGLSAAELGCLQSKCHVRSCDACHRQEAGGKVSYTTAQAKSEQACQRCHPVAKDDPDAHFRRGMTCLNCHSKREIHGDGILYDTYMQPGALDTRCEQCHPEPPASPSHTAHRGRLECQACHTLEALTCFNCHIGERQRTGKDVQIEKKGLLFLVNRGGKVTTGNFLSYVAGRKTMITLAPYFFHSVTKKGRACPDCHASANLAQVRAGTLELARWQDGDLAVAQGVIPVIEGMQWNLPFLERRDGRWVPLADAEAPLVQYSGFCSPLTAAQAVKLAQPQPAPKAAAR